MISTSMPILRIGQTPQVGFVFTDHTPHPEDFGVSEYTDKQFNADIKKAKKALDRLERKALKAERQGETRKFP